MLPHPQRTPCSLILVGVHQQARDIARSATCTGPSLRIDPGTLPTRPIGIFFTNTSQIRMTCPGALSTSIISCIYYPARLISQLAPSSHKFLVTRQTFGCIPSNFYVTSGAGTRDRYESLRSFASSVQTRISSVFRLRGLDWIARL